MCPRGTVLSLQGASRAKTKGRVSTSQQEMLSEIHTFWPFKHLYQCKNVLYGICMFCPCLHWFLTLLKYMLIWLIGDYKLPFAVYVCVQPVRGVCPVLILLYCDRLQETAWLLLGNINNGWIFNKSYFVELFDKNPNDSYTVNLTMQLDPVLPTQLLQTAFEVVICFCFKHDTSRSEPVVRQYALRDFVLRN